MDSIVGHGVPVVRMYGVTERGVAVNCMVRGFLPYFYVKPAQSFLARLRMPQHQQAMASDAQLDKNPNLVNTICHMAVNKTLCTAFRKSFTEAILKEYRYEGKKQYQVPNHEVVHRVELVRRETVMGYHPNLTWMLRITMGNPSFVTRARDILMNTPFRWMPAEHQDSSVIGEQYKVFEANIPYPLRCMIDTSLLGCSWVTLKAGTYTQSPPQYRDSNCPIEVMTRPADIQAHAPDDVDPRWGRAPPMTRATIDIE
jgi:DNA polymerase delta subunit 1